MCRHTLHGPGTVSGILLLLFAKQYAITRRPEVIHCFDADAMFRYDRQSNATIIIESANDGFFELDTKEQF